ncbi:MAG: biotin/lipoyl-binding protein, partial [Candidatus Cloacimonadaceae bacterium]|nr:biotin/lipoyl-binding protein [Candidatus Cloacimonadaceae bacterium]
MKRALWIVLVIVLVLVGWRIYVVKKNQASAGQQSRGETPVPVEITNIEKRTVQDIGLFGGSLKPKSGYTLAPKVSGRLNKLMVNLGDRVSNGQLIAVLEDEVYVQQLEQSRAALAVAQAQVEQTRLALKASEANWTAVKNLYDQNYSSQAAMDQTDAEKAAAKARYDIALAEVQRAQSLVKTAEIQLSYTQIKAVWNNG